MLKTVEKKQHKKKKEQWVNSSCGLSHSALRGNELTWEYGRMHGLQAKDSASFSIYQPPPIFFFFFTVLLIWCFALRNSAAPPILWKSAHSLSHIPFSTSLSLPPSLTCPDINDTAIWGSGSSPALFPSCRLHSYTCTHSLTPNKILDTHPHTYTGHLQAHTHAHTYKNTTIHSKFISEAATDAFSLHTLI